jgi:CxxC motif-containing protein (DUF1111 family)
MPKFEVISPIYGLPDPYEGTIGEEVELTEKVAKPLVGVGALKPIAAKTAKEKAADK